MEQTVKLYGDGINDDHAAIQAMLDSGKAVVYLPLPKVEYIISSTLFIHSGQTLRLEPGARIKLAEKANCSMIEDSEDEWDEDITVCGGIWDMNHAQQSPNPWHFPDAETGLKAWDICEQQGYTFSSGIMSQGIYTGMCMRFHKIRRFRLSDVTIVNPVTYGGQFSHIEDFTIENVNFIFNEGSPKLWNMDGVHIEGGCKNGVIRNLKGACHDDLVAITSDDGIWGPIENIVVDGIFAENCHSAVRLLSMKLPVRNIHITNIFGSYYVYCVTLSKYYKTDDRSGFENISIDHIYASICKGTVDVAGNYEPLIAIGHGMTIRKLSISHLYRNETHCPNAAIGIREDTYIGKLSVSECDQTTTLDESVPFISNKGTIGTLYMYNVDNEAGELIVGEGKIENTRMSK